MMSSIVRSVVALVLAQCCCADSFHLPNNYIGDEASGSSALCMIDFSPGQADTNLMNPQTVKIPKTLPFASTHAGRNVILTTTNYVAPPLVAVSRMISVIIGGASPQLMIINQVGDDAIPHHLDILRGLGGADENRMKSQTLEILKTHTLAETYAIGNNALGNEEECALALACEETINGPEETAHKAVIDLPTNLGWVPMPWLYGNMHRIVHQLEDVLQSLVLYQAMLLVAISVISTVICFILFGSIRLSKIIVSGQRMIMMKPSAVAKNRYDLGVYVYIGDEVAQYRFPALSDLDDGACLVQLLGPELKDINPTVLDNDGDRCLDYRADKGDKDIKGFTITNFEIECKPGANGNATISACFAWNQNSDLGGNDTDAQISCPKPCHEPSYGQCLWPGTSSEGLPNIDGNINQAGDGWGDNLYGWNGNEYYALAHINMTISGNRSGSKYDVVGEALTGYDCSTKKFCVAAYLSNIAANEGCGIEDDDPDEAWVKFGPDSTECSLNDGTTTLNNNTLDAQFKYVIDPDASGRTIGYEACWDMTYEAGFKPGVLIKVHVNRLCGQDAEDTIATEEQCLFWIACPTASPTTASPTTERPTFTPTTARPTPTNRPQRPTKRPTTKKPTKRPITKRPK
ncbi:LOW QUALITY PROTEIN: hypothetical protein ACHAW5_000427 [Stephanodiscus triporus]|uniref:Uncharacterized protein n=1 Tax=Stephanodiscus triporus TaxID=2934178 RepID=A0ABD3Q396_9STRA